MWRPGGRQDAKGVTIQADRTAGHLNERLAVHVDDAIFTTAGSWVSMLALFLDKERFEMSNVQKDSGSSLRRWALRIAVLITAGLAATAAACGDSTSPSTRFDGVYGLATVNGQPLPWTFDSTASSKFQLVSATIRAVTASGGTTLYETEEDQTSVPGQSPVTTPSADTLSVTVDGNGQIANTQFSGSFTSGGLTLLIGGVLFVFQKAVSDPP